jgi:quinoprotein glucose dehydrogenase
VDGREVKAVAQVTKQGLTFVLDRLTGEPVWPIEERPVPQSDVPSERTAPTQPYPTKPAPFERVGVTSADLIDFTPELRAEAERIAARFRLGPIYTPPSLRERDGTQGTLILPGIMGGVNWPGAAFDPETGVLYIPSITDPTALAVGEPDPARSNLRYNRVGGAAARGPQGLPLIRPPWGRITAIDLNSGEHLWMTPNGDTPEFVRNHPALAGVEIPRTGQPGRAGALVTKSLLFVGEGNNLFAAAQGAGGTKLRAYDKRTGEIVSEFDLPAQQTGVPMSYMHEGRQYIVIAVGARNHPGELVALALAPPEMFAADRLK